MLDQRHNRAYAITRLPCCFDVVMYDPTPLSLFGTFANVDKDDAQPSCIDPRELILRRYPPTAEAQTGTIDSTAYQSPVDPSSEPDLADGMLTDDDEELYEDQSESSPMSVEMDLPSDDMNLRIGFELEGCPPGTGIRLSRHEDFWEATAPHVVNGHKAVRDYAPDFFRYIGTVVVNIRWPQRPHSPIQLGEFWVHNKGRSQTIADLLDWVMGLTLHFIEICERIAPEIFETPRIAYSDRPIADQIYIRSLICNDGLNFEVKYDVD